jgi:sulfonate transport system substrate-binding protein
VDQASIAPLTNAAFASAGERKASSMSLGHVDAYAAAWAEETGVPVDVARQTLLARGFAPAPIDAAMIADQQRTVDLYVKEGVLPTRYDAASGFESSFNA